MIIVRFACGHVKSLEDTVSVAPSCSQCGETRVQSVQAPAPRFTGFCSGPVATTKDLEPHQGKLTNG